jgi:glycosyltransferase involved in cell wall biosynthesis
MKLATGISFISVSTARDIFGDSWGEYGPVIYNGVPEIQPSDPARPTTDLLYVGTKGHRKRVRQLPDVLARVREQLPNTTLRIVGFRVEDDPELQRLFAEEGLTDAVLSEGRMPSAQVASYYAAARVLLVPSAYEGLPMVILEAARYGVPCVATDVSGHPEVISPGSNGFLVAVDDSAAMAERAVSILSDPTLQESMGTAARRIVEDRFSVAQQVRQYLDLYESLAMRAPS